MPIIPGRPPLNEPFIDTKTGQPSVAWQLWFQQFSQPRQAMQTTIAAAYTASPADEDITVTSGTFTLKFPISPKLQGKTWTVFNQGAGTITFQTGTGGAVLGLGSLVGVGGVIVKTDGVSVMVFN